MFVADEQMRYVAANEFVAQLLGYTRPELLRLRVTDVAQGPDTEAHYLQLATARGREGVEVLTRKDGSTVEVRYAATETRVAGMPLYVTVVWPE